MTQYIQEKYSGEIDKLLKISNNLEDIFNNKRYDIFFSEEILNKINFVKKEIFILREKFEEDMQDSKINEGIYLSLNNKLLRIFNKSNKIKNYIDSIVKKFPILSFMFKKFNLKDIKFTKKPIYKKNNQIENDLKYLMKLNKIFFSEKYLHIIIICQIFELVMNNYGYFTDNPNQKNNLKKKLLEIKEKQNDCWKNIFVNNPLDIWNIHI